MSRYFKLVSLNDPAWIVREFGEGRVRFGWSPPGTDLREIKNLPWDKYSPEQRVTWRYTKFLLERVSPGDRVLVQPEQLMERFLIGEVIAPGYAFAPGTLEDFNHLLHVRPLTPSPIPVNSKAVSAALKHDLSKRGHYYEVYPEPSIQELDRLVEAAQSSTLALGGIRSDEDTRDKTLKAIKQAIVKEISRQWPVHDFERFCESLCNTLDYVEVKERKEVHPESAYQLG